MYDHDFVTIYGDDCICMVVSFCIMMLLQWFLRLMPMQFITIMFESMQFVATICQLNGECCNQAAFLFLNSFQPNWVDHLVCWIFMKLWLKSFQQLACQLLEEVFWQDTNDLHLQVVYGFFFLTYNLCTGVRQSKVSEINVRPWDFIDFYSTYKFPKRLEQDMCHARTKKIVKTTFADEKNNRFFFDI